MSGHLSLFSQVLDKGDAPLGLFKYPAKKWVVPEAPQDFTASRSLRLNTDSATGAVSDTGFLVIKALGALVLRGDEGLDKLTLLALNEDGLVSVLRSLFQVGESAYEDGPGELFAIRSDITSDGLPAIVRLKAINFASNGSPFRLDFQSPVGLRGQRVPACGRGQRRRCAPRQVARPSIRPLSDCRDSARAGTAGAYH